MKKQSEPTLEQWKELYEVAKNIRKLAPWEYLWDTDLITLLLPGRKEPVYCSVMGRNRECYGIGVYPGYDSITRFYRITEADPDDPPFIAGFEQNCLMCFYGDRDDLSPKDREIIKSLDLRFRGKNEWIYFQAMEPGYYPWYINAIQAQLLIEALQNFAMACDHIRSGKITVNFDAGETLIRFYSPEKELWMNTAAKMPAIPAKQLNIRITDELMVARMSKKKQTKAELEMEVAYLPAPIQENKEERPYLPRLAVILDKSNGLVLDQHLFDKDENVTPVILDMLAGYIDKHGRPASINVRDDRAGLYIDDFCAKTGIEMITGDGVPAIDNMLAGMLNAFR